jgi:autotransporter-associated beta strand protein
MVTASRGGYLIFYGDSTAARSEITIRAGASGYSGIQFYDNATAADAQIVAEDSGGNIIFWGNSSAGDPPTADTPQRADFTLGQGNIVSFWDQSAADDAHFTLADRAQIFFQGNSSAGQAEIVAAGGSVYTASPGATITFNSSSTADNATILVTGATAPLASPAAVWFINGSHAGNSTLIANGGTGGGAGATISFTSGATGDTARLVANAGGKFDFAQQFAGGTTTVGSIDGAGTFHLRGTELVVGTRNDDSTVTGQIVDTLVSPTYTGGRLTKVGTGALTLAGANTYSGVTTVNGGTLRVDGSLAGPVIVNSGGTLIGDNGNIPAGVNLNGGMWSPGASPGTMTVGGVTMSPGSTLNFELGASDRDHIILTGGGNVALDGILNISLFGGFTPTIGQTFSLFEGAIGSVTGAFDVINAPIIDGLTLDLVPGAGSPTLQVVSTTIRTADFNSDGTVNGADLANWRSGFAADGFASHAQGDANGDGAANGADFLIWQRQLGGIPVDAAQANVPEPQTAIIMAFELVGVVAAMRRRASRCVPAALALCMAAPAVADYAVQDNIAFNARKINPYTGGEAWVFSDTITLLDESFGPVTIGPLNADPLGVAVEALFGVDLPHLVKLKAGASLSGHTNVNFGYYVTGGRLDISYPASASLIFETAPGTVNRIVANQTYGVDGSFMPGVSERTVSSSFLSGQGGPGYAITPLRTQTVYEQPWFETQSPWASAWVEASANVQSSIFTEAKTRSPRCEV